MMIYSTLFAIGEFLLLEWMWGIVYAIILVRSSIGLRHAFTRMDDQDLKQKEHEMKIKWIILSAVALRTYTVENFAVCNDALVSDQVNGSANNILLTETILLQDDFSAGNGTSLQEHWKTPIHFRGSSTMTCSP